MTETSTDEIIAELKKLDLKSAPLEDPTSYKSLIEKICCNNLKKVECKNHFLTPTLMTAIFDSLNKSSTDNKKANAANLVAELAKYDACKEFVINPNLVSTLIGNLESTNVDVLLQTCRALGNICYENSEGQKLILDHDRLNQILTFLENSAVPNRPENNPAFKAAVVGLLLNLIADNEKIHKQVFERNVLKTFIDLIKADLRNNKATPTSQNIFISMVALTETIPVEQIFTEEVCDLAVQMFKTSYNDDFCITGLDFLEDAEVPDCVKFNLAKAGLFQLFISFLNNKAQSPTKEELNKYDLTGRVLANILTGDEAMYYLYEVNNGEIMAHLTKWLSSEDKELVYTAVLCIGNVARTDKHSTDIVEKEIHKSLMNILKDETSDIKMQYAVLSTIRNLSIPKANKVKLVNDGVVDFLLPLINLDLKTSSPVIFKLVGTLRQVVDGNEKLAIDLGKNEKLVSRLNTWSSATVCPWVSSECCRLLCWLVKISKDRNVMLNILRHGGYDQIMKLLGALHGLMQSEAVSALTITSALVLLEKEKCGKESNAEADEAKEVKEATNAEAENVIKKDGNFEINLGENSCLGESVSESDGKYKNLKLVDFDVVLVEGNIGEKTKHLIVQHGGKMDEHILENVFTFLEVVVKFDKVKQQLISNGFKPVFHSTMQSRSDHAKFKSRIEGIENSF